MASACRLCRQPLDDIVADLGEQPLANSYLTAEQLKKPEPFYPLCVMICRRCLLVQLPEVKKAADIFSDYAYFSSFSDSWLAHAKAFAEKSIERFHLSASSSVVEIASNDGYLLQYFKARDIPVRGIEPAANVAKTAIEKGIPTDVVFLGADTAATLATRGVKADLLIGNNVLAHVPDLHSFVSGLQILLKPTGVISLEFPHLLQLMRQSQFDTIYHEHFSYLSLRVVRRLFAEHGLTVWDVEELPTHGGSLRVFARHRAHEAFPVTERVDQVEQAEKRYGLESLETYRRFDAQVKQVKKEVVDFLARCRKERKRVVGYGAPAKGNTLLNYCGVRSIDVAYTVDRSPHKQKLYLPGSRIPIVAPEQVRETKPDYLWILPWNLRDEIRSQMAAIRDWGGQFVVAIPKLEIF